MRLKTCLTNSESAISWYTLLVFENNNAMRLRNRVRLFSSISSCNLLFTNCSFKFMYFYFHYLERMKFPVLIRTKYNFLLMLKGVRLLLVLSQRTNISVICKLDSFSLIFYLVWLHLLLIIGFTVFSIWYSVLALLVKLGMLSRGDLSKRTGFVLFSLNILQDLLRAYIF